MISKLNWVDRAAYCADKIFDIIAVQVRDPELAPERANSNDALQSLELPHLLFMALELRDRKVDGDTKACRWLGWLQAGVVSHRLATLEQMKQINLASGKIAVSPAPESAEGAETHAFRLGRIEGQMRQHGGIDSVDMEWLARTARRAHANPTRPAAVEGLRDFDAEIEATYFDPNCRQDGKWGLFEAGYRAAMATPTPAGSPGGEAPPVGWPADQFALASVTPPDAGGERERGRADEERRARIAAEAEVARLTASSFQARCQAWLNVVTEGDTTDLLERVARFYEEATEWVQALGFTADDAAAIQAYVFSRPAGDPPQEIGGTLTTAAVLAQLTGQDMMACAERELARVWAPEIIEKIRRKRATRHGRGPLPGFSPIEHDDEEVGRDEVLQAALHEHQEGEAA